jgi:hypothetical protein
MPQEPVDFLAGRMASKGGPGGPPPMPGGPGGPPGGGGGGPEIGQFKQNLTQATQILMKVGPPILMECEAEIGAFAQVLTKMGEAGGAGGPGGPPPGPGGGGPPQGPPPGGPPGM